MNSKIENLIWIDLEMTGLDTTQDRIIEIATIVTDHQLNTLAEGPVLAIHQTEAILATMDDWNTRQHTNSGLIERSRKSDISELDAENSTLAFLMEHVPANKSPMCGNGICQDRRFLFRWMPRLERYFHYRNFDVSTIKEMIQRWKPEIMEGLRKKSKHLALDDVRESILELRYYLQRLFKP